MHYQGYKKGCSLVKLKIMENEQEKHFGEKWFGKYKRERNWNEGWKGVTYDEKKVIEV